MLTLFSHFPVNKSESRDITKKNNSVKSENNHDWNVYGYENMSVQNFALILKNKMATIVDCLKNHYDVPNLEILQLASSSFTQKIYS